MTLSEENIAAGFNDPMGRLWIFRKMWPYVRPVLVGLLPYPDLIARRRMRRAARHLVTLKRWPGMEATSQHAAQLVLLELLHLQKQVRRSARGRHRDGSAALARTCVEALILGLYLLTEPDGIKRLHSGNLKSLGDALAFLQTSGIVPTDIIRQCIAHLGQPGKTPTVWEMVAAIDADHQNCGAEALYRRLYVPLSNLTVHANGSQLLRFVRGNDKLRHRPARVWNLRSASHVADAAAATMAAALAKDAGHPAGRFTAYADQHSRRALLPVLVAATAGFGGGALSIGRLASITSNIKDTYRYLWKGEATADTPEARIARVRHSFAAALSEEEMELPPGTLDPFIDYISEWIAGQIALEPGK